MAVINLDTKPANKLNRDELSEFFEKLDFSVVSFGKWTETEVYGIENFTISDYELIYYAQGVSSITKNGQTMTVHAGEFVLLEPFQLYTARSIGEQPVMYYYIHFSFLPYYLLHDFEKLFPQNPISNPLGNLDETRQHYEHLLGLKKQLRGYALRVKLYLIVNLIVLANQNPDRIPDVSERYSKQEQDIVRKCTELVLNRLDQPVKIKQLANECGVSETLLYKSFMDVMDQPPSRYFMTLKLRIAQQSLMFDEKSMKEIADSLGFSSPFHFSKAYKEAYGIAPLQAKKMYHR